MSLLTTDRLVLRPLQMNDLAGVYRFLDARPGQLSPDPTKWEQREAWLEWTVLGYEQFARLQQPPYGERAISLRQTGQLIGLAGYVPVFDALLQIPALAPAGGVIRGVNGSELGLYYHVAESQRRRGYATEAAQALVDFALAQLRAWRVVATTTHHNVASIAVMRRLGMAILENPHPEPEYLQIVGVRYHPAVLAARGS